MNPTQEFAATFVDQLASSGLKHACIAPGSRSAPLAMAMARHPAITVFMHLDERCCAFFALGIAKAGGLPVALLCTSGTAAAEFHPAVIEAHHSRTPLLVLTADRPPELREVGANQAIDQVRLYGSAVRWSFDPGPPEDSPLAPAGWRRLAARALAEAVGPPPGPVHLNLPLREPLVPAPGAVPVAAGGPATAVSVGQLQPTATMVAAVAEAFASAHRPLIVAGEMRDGARLAESALTLGVPLLAEPSSQLRVPGAIAAYDALLRDSDWASAWTPDLVLRLGATPTSKPLNQWLAGSAGARTYLVDASGWRDPDLAATDLFRCDAAALLQAVAATGARGPADWLAGWRHADRRAGAAIDSALEGTPMHEGHVVRALVPALPASATVMVGSSMAIRDVDSFWPAGSGGRLVLGNRGASGIDGLVSTGLGAAVAGPAPAVLLLGDLSLYHDMNGLWAVRRHAIKPLVVVLDNDGGGIFSFLPPAEHPDVFEELFGTPLGLDLEAVARLYGLEFAAVSEPAGLAAALSGALSGGAATMVAVRFSREESVAGHRRCWQAVAEALR